MNRRRFLSLLTGGVCASRFLSLTPAAALLPAIPEVTPDLGDYFKARPHIFVKFPKGYIDTPFKNPPWTRADASVQDFFDWHRRHRNILECAIQRRFTS